MHSSRKTVPTPLRRFVLVATVSLGALLSANCARSQSFPYQARVVVPGAPLRSGPGDEFYITDTLPEGQTIEVYRHRPSGWCAVRPTDGSFSWVYGPHIHLLDDSLGEVDKPDVASRIGSRLSRQRNAVQVRLKKGEVVQVLEVANEGGQTWYKIAPPAGEFRWIHRSCISTTDESGEQRRTPPGGVSDAEPNSNQNNVVHESASSASETHPTNKVTNPIVTLAATEEVPASTTPPPATTPPQPLVGADWRAAPLPPPLATTSPSPTPAATNPFQAAASPAAEPAKTENSPAATTVTPVAVTPVAAAPTTPAASNLTIADDLSRDLTEVELRLSRMITEPPATWQIAPLQNEAEKLLTRARTVTERDAVKLTLEKVDRFAAIQRRHQQLASAPQPGVTAAVATPSQPQPPSMVPTADTAGGQYDAVGVLRPVVSKRPGAPQFALVDQRGQVVSFVSATPDLNLQPFVGHRIGIAGNRGFIPEFHRAHVTAGRVTTLDQSLVR